MIRDITLGQYYPGNSYVHRLDPRVKILATLLYIVSLFVVDDFIGFAVVFLSLIHIFFYGGIAWLALYCAVLLLRKRKLVTRGSFVMLIVVIVAAEMISSVCTAFDLSLIHI